MEPLAKKGVQQKHTWPPLVQGTGRWRGAGVPSTADSILAQDAGSRFCRPTDTAHRCLLETGSPWLSLVWGPEAEPSAYRCCAC